MSKCLESIRNQTYENIEIIIVNKNSRDKTVEIAKNYSAKERSEQRISALSNQKENTCNIVDSDFVVEPEVIEEAVRKCENEGYDAICVYNIFDPTISFWSKVRKRLL